MRLSRTTRIENTKCKMFVNTRLRECQARQWMPHIQINKECAILRRRPTYGSQLISETRNAKQRLKLRLLSATNSCPIELQRHIAVGSSTPLPSVTICR